MNGIQEEVEEGLSADIANMLQDEHVSIMTDGWTFCANDSYMSLTVAFITAERELVILT